MEPGLPAISSLHPRWVSISPSRIRDDAILAPFWSGGLANGGLRVHCCTAAGAPARLSLTAASSRRFRPAPSRRRSWQSGAGAIRSIILSQTVRIAGSGRAGPDRHLCCNGWPASAAVHMPAPFDPLGAAVLLVIGVAGAFACRLLRIPNPYFLGPLAAVGPFGYRLWPYFYPASILSGAQVVLGVWLGSTFRRSLFQSAAGWSRRPSWRHLPSGDDLRRRRGDRRHIGPGLGADGSRCRTRRRHRNGAEAKFLGQDVALITAFHLIRIFIFMPNIPWVIDLIHRYEKRRPPANDQCD